MLPSESEYSSKYLSSLCIRAHPTHGIPTSHFASEPGCTEATKWEEQCWGLTQAALHWQPGDMFPSKAWKFPVDHDENTLHWQCWILLFPLSPCSFSPHCSQHLQIAARRMFAVKEQSWKIWIQGDPKTEYQLVCLGWWVRCELLQRLSWCWHHINQIILESLSERRRRGCAELLPHELGLPRDKLSKALIFPRVEVLQCKGGRAACLHSNWGDIYVCANTARAFCMIWS